jgi:hypothetical protein
MIKLKISMGCWTKISKTIGINHRDWGNHLGLMEFCYNLTKHLVTRVSPFDALGIEAKQPMDLAISKTRDHC